MADYFKEDIGYIPSEAFYEGLLGDREFAAAKRAGWKFPGKKSSIAVHNQMMRYLERPDVKAELHRLVKVKHRKSR